MKQRSVALVLLFVFLFHILRNLSGAYYLVLAGFCGLFFLLFINNWRDIKYSALGIFVIFFWTYASLVSVLWFDLYGDYSIGIFRLWASLPLLFVAMVLARDNLKVPMQLISFFFSLAALSFLWQYVFGPIEWFAEASERAGGARFASLVGSLTAYGVMVGVPALASLFYLKGLARVVCFFLLCLGAMLSLQKAALANIVIVLFFAYWLKLIKKTYLFFTFLLAGLGLSVFFLADFGAGSLETVHRLIVGLLTSDSSVSQDVPFFESIFDRVTALPLETLSFYGSEILVLGAGVFGGGGVLGYAQYPMAHNGIVELLCIYGFIFGGLAVLLLLLLFVYSVFLLVFRRRKTACTELGFLCSAFIIWFVNYVFSGGGLFHPVGAALFWLVVFRFLYILRRKRDVEHISKEVVYG
ncbi:hypothetical protein [Pseudomonas aeruginosa]|uniref:hypothetical protein n=1 Tax=Pseudomonas aeruginosa TaxID=287 RepID=UPI0015C50A29|nr:hypothetical protein [Pseudomonas aeruginosa]